MNKEKINLEFLELSRKKINVGDVFVIKPKEKLYYYGIVANVQAKQFTFEQLIHIHIFNCKSEKGNVIPVDLQNSTLLIPPILTNKLGWRKGYFKTIGNMSTNKFDTIKKASFYYYNGEIYDDNSKQLSRPNSIETTGSFSVTSYLNIDNMISLKLGIPLAVSPPENWNPFWYQKELCEKYNLQ